MIDTMTTNYAAPLLRAFRQAPWRTQTQAVAAWSVTLLIALVVGGLYLTVAARAAAAGRDLQALEARKVALIQENDLLRAQLAQLRAVTRLADRARQLGLTPARPDQIEYLRVEHFPRDVVVTPPPRAEVAELLPETTLAQLEIWLVGALNGLMARVGGG